MAPLAKIGAGVLTIGTVGGVGYGIVAYSQDKGTEISKLVEQEYQYILLDTKDGTDNEDITKWGTNWESYKKVNENNDKDFFGLDGWKKENTPDLKDKLREKCQELSKSKIQSKKDKLYSQVTSYCGRHVSIKDQAKKDKLRIIDTKNGGDAWTKLVAKENEIKADLTNLGITAQSSKITEKEIKDGCAKALEKNKSQEGYNKAYSSYKVVCASE